MTPFDPIGQNVGRTEKNFVTSNDMCLSYTFNLPHFLEIRRFKSQIVTTGLSILMFNELYLFS